MTEFSPPPPTFTRGLNSERSSLRIVIADARAMFRNVLRLQLEAEDGLSVVGTACDSQEAVRCVLDRRPHILLFALDLITAGDSDALSQVRDSDTGVRTVVLAGVTTRPAAVTALTLGVRGVLYEDSLPSELCGCVRAVAEGDYWIGNERVFDVVDALHCARAEASPEPANVLTPSEERIAAAVWHGATNGEIGVSLGVGVETVEALLNRMFEKVGASSRFDLALYASRHGLDSQNLTPEVVQCRQDLSPRRHSARV
jgi:two-component system, NarL family, nitrate/nitrite response regulator NarL